MARSSRGTEKASLMCTSPTVSSRSPRRTGKRECPVSMARAIRSLTVSSTSRELTVERGDMTSSAVVSPNWSERSSIFAVAASNPPASAELRTMAPNSGPERAEANSSAGSIPSLRTNQFADALRPLMNQAHTVLNALTGGTTKRAVCKGLEIARFFGTSSPKTIDSVVATMRARIKATGRAADSLNPTSSRSGPKNRARTGSARKPVASVVMVMPSCAPESTNERLPWSRCTARAVLSPFSWT